MGGSSRAERGKSLGGVIGRDARKIYDLKVSMYKSREGMMAFWDKIAAASKSYIETYAPLTWEEMQGFSESRDCDMDLLLKLATEYEMLMANGHFDLSGGNDPGKCTGMATTFSANGGVVCAQTNDENPNFWHGAKYDVVIHSDGKSTGDLSTMIYTHPGYPAYMGMNSAGVCVLWQYIDNGERACDKGLPTCVILREILKHRTAKEAVDWLRAVPRTVPNNYMLCDQENIYNIECSPTRFTVLEVDEGDMVHSNHCVIDQQMMSNDIGLEHSLTSEGRFKALRSRLTNLGDKVTVDGIKNMYATAPLLRTDGSTLATMIFEPTIRKMHMRFKGDSRSPLNYKTYPIPEEEWEDVESVEPATKVAKKDIAPNMAHLHPLPN